MSNNNDIVICNEGMHFTGARAITDDNHPFLGGVEIIQEYPDMMMGVNSERVVLRQEDLEYFAKELLRLSKELDKQYPRGF